MKTFASLFIHQIYPSIAYSYTDNGKPERTTWARDGWKENAYDSQERLTGISYSDSTPSVAFGYNAFSYLTAASNTIATYAFSRSLLGIATNETVAISGEDHVLIRKLDTWQRLQELSVDGQPLAVYAYDDDNKFASVSNTAFAVEYAYTPDGYDAGYSVTLTNGIMLDRVVSRDIWRRNLITQISNGVDNASLSTYRYDYDELNRATRRNDDTFGYNARSEVTSASISNTVASYTYDNIGNNQWTAVNGATNTYTANSFNQYTAILCAPEPLREPTYDLDGNMISNGDWSYTWDAENRLVVAYSNSVCVISNAYDYMNRRVKKVTPEATRTFVYDGWNLVQETVASASNVTTNTYVWGKDLSGTMQGAGGIGGLLAVSLNGTWYFPVCDNNGNITTYVDKSGSVVAEYTFDAFGETIAQSGSMANTFCFRFSTKYYDHETGLYYYGMRFYSPDLHRWLNRDPIEENGGLNVYGFCGNDGLNNWDGCGLATVKYISDKKTSIWQRMRSPGLLNELTEVKKPTDVCIEYKPYNPQDSWGNFYHTMDDITISDGDCEIIIFLKIYLQEGLVSQGEKGVKYTYDFHTNSGGVKPDGGNSGAFPETKRLVEGSVLAHERGHAEGFLNYIKPCFDKEIARKYPGTLKKSDERDIRNIMRDFRKKTMNEHVRITNQRTIEWYTSNGYKRTNNARDYYVFEKK